MTDDAIQSAFLDLLPYYWWNAADLPARVKLILLINKWPSVVTIIFRQDVLPAGPIQQDDFSAVPEAQRVDAKRSK